MIATMYLRTLGKLELEGSDLRRPKLLLLLSYLSLEGPKSRRHLAELLWPTATDPATSVRMALMQVRKLAHHALSDSGDEIGVSVTGDAREFLMRVDDGEPGSAIELYRGPFLPAFHLSGLGTEIEEWVLATRDLLAERARHALLQLGERDAAVGDLRAGARRAAQALALEAAPPEPEEFRRLHTLLVAGDSPRAAEVVKAAREFGLELSLSRDSARSRLYAPASRFGQQAGGPAGLPSRTTEFIGRDLELLELSSLLAQPGTSLVTLVGPGGVGKTSLAVQLAAAEARAGRFSGGVHFVALESLSDPEQVIPAIATALGVGLSDDEAPLAKVAAFLREHESLVVLDNFEHLPAAADGVASLLGGAPGVRVLITAREPLGLTAEQVVRLEGLELPPEQLGLAAAQHQEAVALFVLRARRARSDFVLMQSDVQHVIDICRSVEGLPLGIELAAGGVRHMQPLDIATEVRSNLDSLVSGKRDVPLRHQSLRATFEYSWALLASAQRTLLARLSVFTGGFTRDAAARVAGATIPLLGALVDKSLLRWRATGRYDMHPLIHAFASEKLRQSANDREQVRTAHAGYIVDLAEAAEEGLKGSQQGAWLQRLDAEIGNLRAALDYEAPEGMEARLRILGALWQYWPTRGRIGEWRGRFSTVLSQTQEKPTAVRAKALSGAGTLAFAQHDWSAAGAYHSAALAIRRELGGAWGVAASLYNLGGVHAAQGELVAARPLFEESLAVMRHLGNTWSVALALSNLGLLEWKLGDETAARERFQESLRLRRELGDTKGVAEALKHLGQLAWAVGDVSGAIPNLNEALTLEMERLAVHDAADSLEVFASIATGRGFPRHAVLLWTAARSAREAAEAPVGEETARLRASEIEAARRVLGAEEFAATLQEGTALSLEQAVALALAGPDTPRPH